MIDSTPAASAATSAASRTPTTRSWDACHKNSLPFLREVARSAGGLPKRGKNTGFREANLTFIVGESLDSPVREATLSGRFIDRKPLIKHHCYCFAKNHLIFRRAGQDPPLQVPQKRPRFIEPRAFNSVNNC